MADSKDMTTPASIPPGQKATDTGVSTTKSQSTPPAPATASPSEQAAWRSEPPAGTPLTDAELAANKPPMEKTDEQRARDAEILEHEGHLTDARTRQAAAYPDTGGAPIVPDITGKLGDHTHSGYDDRLKALEPKKPDNAA